MLKLTALVEVDDAEEFWSGTRVRIYGVGMNVPDKTEDYYDYMLATIPGEREFMLVTNVTTDAGRHKAGASTGLIRTVPQVDRFVVVGSTLKEYFGLEKVYLLKFAD